MKFLAVCTPLIILFASMLSCSDEEVTMLYHPAKKPVFYWLLKSVNYPDGKLGTLSQKDFTLSYNNNDSLKMIDILDSEFILVDYSDKRVSFSKWAQSNTTIVYDSMLVQLNDRKQAEYILHLSYMGKEPLINDSIALFYNSEGYLIQLESYKTTDDPSSLRHTEKYTIENGNIIDVLSTTDGIPIYKHTYTYDNTEHVSPAEYCYAMPYNTMAFAANECWLLNNLPFLSKYLGKKSKNNIVRTIITPLTEKRESYVYGDIKYDYTYDENKMVSKVKISGTVNNNPVPDEYTTTFSYLMKEKE